MKLSRKDFLKINGKKNIKPITSGVDRATPLAAPSTKLRNAQRFTTICPYCAVGCGQVLSVVNGKVINVEGDPEHPINQGSLCSKGNALLQVANNERRLTKVLYRAPKSDRWQEKSWDWALEQIARRIKDTRDKNWVEKDNNPLSPFPIPLSKGGRGVVTKGGQGGCGKGDGFTVNRTEAIACLGGAALDNEECYLYSKLARALGIVYLEHQARI
jgi:formate dehydrogenase major subunit